MNATYSPEDNKLRLYSETRLDRDLYDRVKKLGFRWAPKQEVFVCPRWTPAAEDLLIELCGEVGDEDTTLVERAEQRADRFTEYRGKRTEDAERAHAAVHKIADGIPLGQPILIGHHSERHARRDAEKIENGMRKAVQMWDTAEYWKYRAAGALANAKYKEIPAVRMRRIKGLESDLRVLIASYTPQAGHPQILQTRWNAKPEAEPEPHAWCGTPGRGGNWVPVESLERIKQKSKRWEDHYANRIAYEYAMLAESGGLAADKFNIEVGGRVRRRSDWMVVARVNRKDGQIVSLSVIGHFASTMPIEDVLEYEAPKAGDAEKVKKITTQKPLVNFRAAGCVEMTQAQWKNASRFSDSYFVTTYGADGQHTYGRLRDGEQAILYRQRSQSSGVTNWKRVPVFLVDAPVKQPPAIVAPHEPVVFEHVGKEPHVPYVRPADTPEETKFDALRTTLKAGVKVVSANQLFPTPVDLARRMVELAEIQPGETVLEPSAGTGNIVRAIVETVDTEIVGYELNYDLAAMLKQTFPSYRLHVECKDFLTVKDGQGQFPCILMNPPFQNGDDIKHIQHAQTMLKPGGRLIAICANGPRQNAALSKIAEFWEELPAGTFEGTNVRAVLLAIRKPEMREA